MKVSKQRLLHGNEAPTGPKRMPSDLQTKLRDMSINEAILAGLVTSIGNEKGEFLFHHADEGVPAMYGVVNGYAVRVSDQLSKTDHETIRGMEGDLRFTEGISTIQGDGFGKRFFRLGYPAGIRLGKAHYTVSTAVPVDVTED